MLIEGVGAVYVIVAVTDHDGEAKHDRLNGERVITHQLSVGDRGLFEYAEPGGTKSLYTSPVQAFYGHNDRAEYLKVITVNSVYTMRREEAL